ncbi:hypothetical protein LCGC14_1603740, partial [marine sediment metagenome]
GIRDIESQRLAEEIFDSALKATKESLVEVNEELAAGAKLSKVFPVGPLGGQLPTGFEVGGQEFGNREKAVIAQEKLVKLTDQYERASELLKQSLEGTFDPEKYNTAVTSMEGVKIALENAGFDKFSEKITITMTNATDAATAMQNIKLSETAIAGIKAFTIALKAAETQAIVTAAATAKIEAAKA